jgi:hypothetical protein
MGYWHRLILVEVEHPPTLFRQVWWCANRVRRLLLQLMLSRTHHHQRYNRAERTASYS